MSDSTRRGFLKVAGAGAAVAAGVAVVPSAAGAAEARSSAPTLPASASGPLVAHVTDVRKGEVALMVEGHEVTIVDHELVARLASALHKANAAHHAAATRSV